MLSGGSTIFSYDTDKSLKAMLSGVAVKSSGGVSSEYKWSMRSVTRNDLAFHQQLFGNATIMMYFADGQVQSAERVQAKIENWVQRSEGGHPHGSMTVFNDADQMIGYVATGLSDEAPGTCELAGAGLPELWGRGIGHSVMKTIIQTWAPEVRRIGISSDEAAGLFKCFDNEALPRLYATASPANPGSWKTLDDAGFKAAQYKLNTTIARLDYDGKKFANAKAMEAAIMENFDPRHELQPLPINVRISMVDPKGTLRTLSMHEKFQALRYHFEKPVICDGELGIV